jgi:hypothetical protein
VSLDFRARRHAKDATGSSPVALVSAKYVASIDRIAVMEMTRGERRAELGEQSGNSLVSIMGMRHTRTNFLLERASWSLTL